MRALIDPRSNRVCQLADADFPVAEPLFWVDCDDTIAPDSYTYADGQFVAPVVIDQPEAQPDPIAALTQQVADLTAALVAKGVVAQADITAEAVQLSAQQVKS
jgi:hypothetical protein